jgi:hypothetical protein
MSIAHEHGTPDHDLALRVQLAIIAGSEDGDSYIEVRPRHPQRGYVPKEDRAWFPVHDHDAAVKHINRIADRLDVWVGCAPRISNDFGGIDAVKRTWALHVDCDDEESSDRLRRFTPLPSLVVASGGLGRLQAWWGLSEPLEREHIAQANRRLAFAFMADSSQCHAGAVLRAVGTMNHKYPAPVRCVYMNRRTYTAKDVVGHLVDPPTPPRLAQPFVIADGSQSARGVGTVRWLASVREGEKRNGALYFAAKRGVEEGWLPEFRDQLIAAAVSTGMKGGWHAAEATVRSAEQGRAA